MKIPIATDGYLFIVPLALLSGLLWYLRLTIPALLVTLLFLFVLYFFRDPERTIPEGENLVVSPADGKVVEIVNEKDPILGASHTRISIFLSVFNVHVNRVPVSGTIETIRYHPGKFLAAFNHKASLDNEQNTVLIKKGNTPILIKQIAGLIARRIVCWAHEGDTYSRGQRYGLIRFGSRVDLLVPENTRLAVAVGDRVRGGASVIGHLQEDNE